MNRLDYIDAMKFGGNGSIGDIFNELGRLDVHSDSPVNEDNETVEMKATTVRMPVDLLAAFDAVIHQFGLSRQDVFAHMVYQFIEDSVAEYCIGYATGGRSKEESEEMVTSKFSDFISRMPDADRAKVKEIVNVGLAKRLGVEVNVTDNG